jgi:hypothetical protein
MKKIIWVCGIIGGLISVGWFIVSEQLLAIQMSMDARLYFGYASIILGLSVIFVAVKSYRDNYGNGIITFGKALGIGLLVTLVASTVYVAIWLIDYNWFYPDYFEKYSSSIVADMKAHGATAAAIQAKVAALKSYANMYKNPIFNALFTYMEIAPVGLVVSLISAVVLRKKQISENINYAN